MHFCRLEITFHHSWYVYIQGSYTHNEFNVCQLIRTDLTLAVHVQICLTVHAWISTYRRNVLICKCRSAYTCSLYTSIYLYYLRSPYEYPMRPLRTWCVHGVFDTYHTSRMKRWVLESIEVFQSIETRKKN